MKLNPNNFAEHESKILLNRQLTVHLKKEANWLYIRRKRPIDFKFEERGKLSVNSKKRVKQPSSDHSPNLSLFQKKIPQLPTSSPFLFFFDRQKLSEKSREIDWRFHKIKNLFASFSKFTANLPLSLNVL